jgi:hypothetical protein
MWGICLVGIFIRNNKMKEALNRIIKNFILPDFPWVKDYEIMVDEKESSDFVTGRPRNYSQYTVIYSPDYNLIEDGNREELKRLETYTYSSVKMLGSEEGFKFGPIIFITANGGFLMLR